jgi:tetratricopeptide (TPR) repeat protein
LRLLLFKFALVYQECGRSLDAIKLLEKGLEAERRTLGEGHPNTLATAANLTNSYSSLGRMQDALRLREEVLDMVKRTLGEEP